MISPGQDGKPAPKPPPAGAGDRVFTGKSSTGNLQEALTSALQSAQSALNEKASDVQFSYRVDAIKGRRGGFAGLNELTVDVKVVETR